MNLEGESVRLRAVEPEDLDRLYAWENDTDVWSVSGTTAPFSRAQLEAFILTQQQGDIFRTGQLRLIVETRAGNRPSVRSISSNSTRSTDAPASAS